MRQQALAIAQLVVEEVVVVMRLRPRQQQLLQGVEVEGAARRGRKRVPSGMESLLYSLRSSFITKGVWPK